MAGILIIIGGFSLTVIYILYLANIVKPELASIFAIYIIAMSVLMILDKLTKTI